MTSPLRKLGVLYIAATPALAGVSMFEFRIGSLNYTGFVWVAQLLAGLCLFSMILLTSRRQLDLAPWWPWLIWIGYLWMSMLWARELDGKNIQDALQYTMPIVVGIIAATTIRTVGEMKLVFAAFVVALLGVSVYTLLFVQEVFDPTWLETHIRSAALTTTVMGCVFLAAFPQRYFWPLFGWGACLAIATLTSSRMATLALLAAFVLHPLVKAFRWKVAAVATCAVLGLALFYTPTFQKHFFAGGSGNIGDLASGKVDDLGRLEAWEQTWYQAVDTPLIGRGVGSIHAFVDSIWVDTDQIHNDYLRLFYEVGLLGLTLFLSVAGWQLLTLRKRIAETRGIARTALAASYLGFCALLITCITDNTITYNLFYTDPLFAMLGSAYGLLASQRSRDEAQAGIEPLATQRWRLEVARRQPFYQGEVAPTNFPVHRGIRFGNN